MWGDCTNFETRKLTMFSTQKRKTGVLGLFSIYAIYASVWLKDLWDTQHGSTDPKPYIATISICTTDTADLKLCISVHRHQHTFWTPSPKLTFPLSEFAKDPFRPKDSPKNFFLPKNNRVIYHETDRNRYKMASNRILGGGFRYFLFSPRKIGEDSHFD